MSNDVLEFSLSIDPLWCNQMCRNLKPMGTILVLWPPPQLLLLCSVPLWGVTLSEVVGWGGCAVVEQSNVSPVMPCMSFLCLEFASCYMHSANGNYFKMKLANGIREVFICLLAIHQCPSTTSHTSMCIVRIPLVLLLFSPSLLLYFFFPFLLFLQSHKASC